ncbi:MAG: porin [Pseudomonadota bacterium]
MTRICRTHVIALTVSTALTAATPALAQFEITVGGFMDQFLGFDDGGGAVTDEWGFNDGDDNELIFDFRGTTDNGLTFGGTADNGLTFGDRINLDDAPADEIDESFLFIAGDFGRIIVGSENGAYVTTGQEQTSVTSESGGAADFSVGLGDYNLTTFRSEGITYFTPRLFGFQSGARYAGGIGYEVESSNGSFSEEDVFLPDGFGVPGVETAGVFAGFATDILTNDLSVDRTRAGAIFALEKILGGQIYSDKTAGYITTALTGRVGSLDQEQISHIRTSTPAFGAGAITDTTYASTFDSVYAGFEVGAGYTFVRRFGEGYYSTLGISGKIGGTNYNFDAWDSVTALGLGGALNLDEELTIIGNEFLVTGEVQLRATIGYEKITAGINVSYDFGEPSIGFVRDGFTGSSVNVDGASTFGGGLFLSMNF